MPSKQYQQHSQQQHRLHARTGNDCFATTTTISTTTITTTTTTANDDATPSNNATATKWHLHACTGDGSFAMHVRLIVVGAASAKAQSQYQC